MAIKRVKRQAQRRKAVRYNLVLNKDKWVRGSDQIKKLRDELSTGSCPVTGTAYAESGMDSAVLDHQHEGEGRVRSVLSSRVNMWEGRCFKYFKKMFRGFSEKDYAQFLVNLGEYLKQEPQDILHGAIIDAEKTRITRWKNETIYNKLVEKGLDLKQLNEYDKRDLVELHLQQFIKEKEEQL